MQKNNMMGNPLISVIVPVYNCEKYIARCVESLLRQSYSNVEVLLVDDGSRDQSGAICDGLAAMDPRVRVIHQMNGGVSRARNTGLEQMNGSLCAFVDADDHLHENALEFLYRSHVQTGCNLVVCDWKCCAPEEKPDQVIAAHAQCRLISVRDEFDFTKPYAHNAVWAGLFTKELIGDVRFDTDLYIGEDALFFAKLLRRTSTLCHVPQALYYYVIYPQSAFHGSFTPKRETEVLAWKRIVALFADHSALTRESCRAKLATAYFAGARCMLEGDNTSAATPEQYLAETRKLLGTVLRSGLPVIYKMCYLLMCVWPGAYMWVYRRMKEK